MEWFENLRRSFLDWESMAAVLPAERTLDVGFPTPEERRHLGIGSSQPVYRMEKTVFGPDGGAISWSRLVTPTQLVTYSIWSGPSGRQA